MTSKIKLYLGRKVADSVKNTKINPMDLKYMLQINQKSKDQHSIEMSISLKDLERTLGITNPNKILSIQPDDIINHIEYNSDKRHRNVVFGINKNMFLKELMENCRNEDIHLSPKKIVVDFSSPNVAKPFHVGHLRSTIIGNFISNIYKYKRDTVTRINYLGDWGTQFGLVKVGLDELKYSLSDMKEKPLQRLYESYVHANKMKDVDASVGDRARAEFSKLEEGCEKRLKDWSTILKYTVKELEGVYKRLGVEFDRYEYESMYNKSETSKVMEELKRARALETHRDGQIVASINNREVPLIKRDGSTLYLTREIAAAIDRHKRFNFDEMIYVVDNAQTDHFNALKFLLQKMNYSWASKLRHVKFGRVKGMSTRKGRVVFLKDILDEIAELMLQNQVNSPTTKAPISDTAITDTLGVSCVVVNELKQRRQRDYEFSWSSVLDVKGDSGVKLQYTHARLCNLEVNSGVVAASNCVPELLHEPEVIALVQEIARFGDVLHLAGQQLEACGLVTYLFQLCNHISKALKVLNVKHEDPIVGAQRMLLFSNARFILGEGMHILGLKPLKTM